METVTISLQKYEELINTSKKIIEWYVEVTWDYSLIEFRSYRWCDQIKLWELVINQIDRNNILKNKRDEDFYSKEKKYLSDKQRDLTKRLKELWKLEVKLNEKESDLDIKYVQNFLFRLWFFISISIIFIMILN